MPDHESLLDRDGAVRCVFAVRGMLRDAITADLVLNPAIDMLLAMYLERHGGRALSRAEVCAHTSVTQEVCRHWGLALEKRGLIVIDGGGYRLSDEGRRVMDEINDRIWSLAKQHLGAAQPG